ncbi:hypothetical protein Gogos_016101 [Gossypium gossypioides]|uniref:Uncharacterized protein n=1 Tax=Gossypium gossypioides TaxID=34282 RepID=A0A7J9B6T2_GOSGO|nr:hypothetical protein [Gossypium gossypioides]
MVYNGKIFDHIQLFETIKLRLGWWCKAQRPTVAISLNDLFLAPPKKSVDNMPTVRHWVVDPVLAETIAIKEALKIFYASK